jgi:hypothetical protein
MSIVHLCRRRHDTLVGALNLSIHVCIIAAQIRHWLPDRLLPLVESTAPAYYDT